MNLQDLERRVAAVESGRPDPGETTDHSFFHGLHHVTNLDNSRRGLVLEGNWAGNKLRCWQAVQGHHPHDLIIETQETVFGHVSWMRQYTMFLSIGSTGPGHPPFAPVQRH